MWPNPNNFPGNPVIILLAQAGGPYILGVLTMVIVTTASTSDKATRINVFDKKVTKEEKSVF